MSPVRHFIAYTEDVVKVYDIYQLWSHNSVRRTATAKGQMSTCIINVHDLQGALPGDCVRLNAGKTEFTWFSYLIELRKLLAAGCNQFVCETVAEPSGDAGVWFDSRIAMKPHISRLKSVYYYHLCRLCQYVMTTRPSLMQLDFAFILFRLDYCNVVLSGLLKSTPARLHQCV
jgi:hypothetical protein